MICRLLMQMSIKNSYAYELNLNDILELKHIISFYIEY